MGAALANKNADQGTETAGSGQATGPSSEAGAAQQLFGNSWVLDGLEDLGLSVGEGGLLGDLMGIEQEGGQGEPTEGVMHSPMLEDLIRALTPRLMDILDEGVVAIYGDEVGAGLEMAFQEVVVSLDLPPTAEGLLMSLGHGTSVLAGAAAGDQSCCHAFEGWVYGFQQVGMDFFENSPSATFFEALDGLATNSLAAFAAELAGGAEGFLKKHKGTIDGVLGWIVQAIETIRTIDSDAADYLADALGLDREGSLLGVMEQLWDELTEGLAEAVQQAIDAALELLFAVPLVEEAYRTVDGALDVIEGVAWLYQHLGEPDLVEKAHEEMGHSWVPGFVTSAQDFIDSLRALGAQVTGQLAAVYQGLVQAAESAVGIPFLTGAVALIEQAIEGVRWVVESPLWGEIDAAFDSFVSWTGDVLWAFVEVMVGIAAVGGNPMALLPLLASQAFQMLPDCYKAQIVDAVVPYIAGLVSHAMPAAFAAAGELGEHLAGMVHVALQGAVEALHGRTVEEKATVLEMIVRLLLGEAGAEFVTGLLVGMAEGLVDEVWGVVQLMQFLNGLLIDVAFFSLTLPLRTAWWSAERMGAAAYGAAQGLDEAGDRHFQEDEHLPKAEGARQELEGDAGPDMEALYDAMSQAVDGLQGGMGDLSGLQDAVGGLWDVFVQAVEDSAGSAMDAVLDGVLLMEEAPYSAGEWTGYLLFVVLGELLLTKGAAALAAHAPKIASLLEAVVVMLKAPDLLLDGFGVVVSRLAGGVLDLVGDVGGYLKSFDNPALTAAVKLLEDLARTLEAWAQTVGASLGLVREAAEEGALGFTPEALATLRKNVEALGDDDLLKVVDDVLRSVSDEQAKTMGEKLKEHMIERLQGLNPVQPPEWFDAGRSARENIEALAGEVAKEELKEAAEAAEGG